MTELHLGLALGFLGALIDVIVGAVIVGLCWVSPPSNNEDKKEC